MITAFTANCRAGLAGWQQTTALGIGKENIELRRIKR
jgi:hypothetical protein